MKSRIASPLPSKKMNLLSSGFVMFILVLTLLLLIVLGGAGCAPAEVSLEIAENDSPFEAFRASRMALPETTSHIIHVDVDSVMQSGYNARQEVITASPQRLFCEEQADLNEDGRRETYILRNGRLTITHQNGLPPWQSPEEWWIDNFYFGDITNDGRQNLCLSVWKEGSYGPYRPFWVEANDTMVRNHLFIYQMESSEENALDKVALKAVWQSSHLARPNYQAFIAQIDGDGENHLVVVQGDYENPGYGEIAFWKWNGWGFSPSQMLHHEAQQK